MASIRRWSIVLVICAQAAACADGDPTSPVRVMYDCQFSIGVSPQSKAGNATKSAFAGNTIKPAFDCSWVPTFYDEQINDHYATGLEGEPDPSAPEWTGENPETLNLDEAARICRPYVENPHFAIFLPGHGTLHFRITGLLNATYINNVSKEGTYQLPPGQWRDDTGVYYITGGTITGRCNIWEFRIPVPTIHGIVYKRVQTGWMTWYPNYTGSLFQGSRPISPTGGNGWAAKWNGVPVFVENGVGVGWEAALDAFTSGGGCTWGWEIWVDGVQRCDRNGNLL